MGSWLRALFVAVSTLAVCFSASAMDPNSDEEADCCAVAPAANCLLNEFKNDWLNVKEKKNSYGCAALEINRWSVVFEKRTWGGPTWRRASRSA